MVISGMELPDDVLLRWYLLDPGTFNDWLEVEVIDRVLL